MKKFSQKTGFFLVFIMFLGLAVLKTGFTSMAGLKMSQELDVKNDRGQTYRIPNIKNTAVELTVKLDKKKRTCLTWKKIPGADGYEIIRSSKKNGKYQTVKKIKSGKICRYTDDKASKGERCYYKVRAFRKDIRGISWGKYSRAIDNGVKKKSDWKITQYGEASGSQMMFYTLQDYHGHLIVVDGGWPQNAEMVRRVLKKKGGHVNAWILTHPHEDHIGAFCDIYKNPGNIKIDKVYAVEMASPKLCLDNAPWDSVTAYQRFRALSISQLKYVHRGDVLKIGKLKIEILSAYEKKIDRLSSDLLNDGSMVFKVYGKEESMLFCADAGKSISDYLKKKYGSKLKSDYLQMGHHGNGGLKKNFYKTVNPDVAFFDAPDWLMEGKYGGYTTPRNRKWMEEMGSKVVSFSTAPNTVVLK
ncbi:MAG: MBL fold metallo-hydrolase [Lachnospiraceae bacterium]|nr:MBL fold metallo-hydrolase [Lachnospiraceae bacterium]